MSEAASTMTLDTLLTSVGTVFTSILSWLTDILTFVTSNPILLVFVLLVLARIVIRICRRWLPGL